MRSTAKMQNNIFRRASKTYYNSSLFFPPAQRRDVFTLYSFVRLADDYVDSVPQQPREFAAYEAAYREALHSRGGVTDGIIAAFIELMHRCQFEHAWIDAFFDAMRWDLNEKTCETLEDTLKYAYGSAEVIGLCVTRIIGLPREADYAARMLGRAMQYINFIRDIAEDTEKGRIYLPLAGTGLKNLTESHCRENEEEYRTFIIRELARYQEWHSIALEGGKYIPARPYIPIKTASDMYDWTMRKIKRDPFLLFKKVVKPKKIQILWYGIMNGIRIGLR